MGARLTATHGHLGVRPSLIAALAVVTLLLTPGATSASAAKSSSCAVTNTDTGRTYTRLQPAVDAAKPGARLIVKGTCKGGTFIDKDIAIVGRKSKRTGRAILDGMDRARVLTIKPGARVGIRTVVIRRGRAFRIPDGGGISNKGELVLRGVVLRRNEAETRTARLARGGGMYNEGTLQMWGASRVHGNHGAEGSGVYNAGTLTMNDSSRIQYHAGGCHSSAVVNTGSLTMNDSSSIHHNISACDLRLHAVDGGGVYNTGSLVLNDASSIHRNSAVDAFMGRRYANPPDTPPARGGGVYNAGSLTMTGSSHIQANEAGPVIITGTLGLGGGLYNASGGTLVGVTCGGNVTGNTPDDCHFEP